LRKLIKQLFLVLAMVAGPYLSSGQDFLPVLNDNYMGINQAFLQPAAIADSRFRSDFNVAGFSNDIYNDAMRFRSRWILYPGEIVTNEDWWDENTYLDNANGRDKNMFFSQSIVGPSFLANLSPKHAIGFTSRLRSIANAEGIDEPLFRLMYSNYQDSEYYNKWYRDENMRAMQHVFGDYGLTYARIIFDKGNHFLKGGATIKLLQGIAASYIQTGELYYYFNGEEYPGAKPISWNSPYAKGGLSDNWGDIGENGYYSFSMNYQVTAKPSVGWDFGVVYEWRPDFYKAVNPHDGTMRADKNKYFVKVGLSVLDLGRLVYEKDYNSSDLILAFTPDYKNRYDMSDNNVPDDTYWLDADEANFTFRNYVNFSQEMHERSVNGEGVWKDASNKEIFLAKLPTAISLQADVNLFLEGLYVNLTTYWGLNQGYTHSPNSHYISNYSITPRYERAWYGASIPISINQYGKVEVGLGVRAGVFYFGVNNLFSNAFSDPYGIHAYAGVKVPILQKDPLKVKPEKEQVPEKTFVCCPCCGCLHPVTDCYECCKLFPCRDTSGFRMECIPSGLLITLTNPVITIQQLPAPEPDTVTMPAPEPLPQPETPPQPAQASGSSGGGIPVPAVYFNTAASALSPSDRVLLDEMATELLKDPQQKLRISGHTDSVGTTESNLILSKKRAEAVYNYLIQKGVPAGQMQLEYHGEDNPDFDNITPDGRQKNRRVEIELLE
jgi:outer membrane protein OmpA-like peptidoglycan-associated protein